MKSWSDLTNITKIITFLISIPTIAIAIYAWHGQFFTVEAQEKFASSVEQTYRQSTVLDLKEEIANLSRELRKLKRIPENQRSADQIEDILWLEDRIEELMTTLECITGGGDAC